MARSKRTNRTALSGGKMALFEVIQAAQMRSGSHLSDAVAPLVASASPPREQAEASAPQPVLVVAASTPGAPAASQLPIIPLEQALRRRRGSRDGGIGAIGFATAIAGAIAIAGAGLVIYQQFGRRAPHIVSTTPPTPEVLDVGNRPATPTYANPSRQTQTQAVAQRPSVAAVVAPDFRRVNGLNYVLVQSYHASEEPQAIAARDALLRAGVGATIEKGVPGWPNRLCVVGTDGFEQMRNNAKYQDYRQRLDEISRSATLADKKIKKFEPTAVQWGRS